jgi:translation initiation factor IF-3
MGGPKCASKCAYSATLAFEKLFLPGPQRITVLRPIRMYRAEARERPSFGAQSYNKPKAPQGPRQPRSVDWTTGLPKQQPPRTERPPRRVDNQLSSDPQNRGITTSSKETVEPAKSKPIDSDSLPRNREIARRFRQVRIAEEGGLSEPVDTAAYLSNIDVGTHDLVCVALPGGSGNDGQYAICRVFNRQDQLAKKKVQQKESKKTKITTKEVEIGWGIHAHDLSYRLERIKGYLTKGMRVEIRVMHLKRKGKVHVKPDPKDARNLVNTLKALPDDVPGASLFKPEDGKLGEIVRFTLQGRAKGDSATSPAGGAEEAVS